MTTAAPPPPPAATLLAAGIAFILATPVIVLFAVAAADSDSGGQAPLSMFALAAFVTGIVCLVSGVHRLVSRGDAKAQAKWETEQTKARTEAAQRVLGKN